MIEVSFRMHAYFGLITYRNVTPILLAFMLMTPCYLNHVVDDDDDDVHGATYRINTVRPCPPCYEQCRNCIV